MKNTYLNILAVDDSENNLFILQEYFDKTEYRLVTTSSAKECFKTLAEEQFDLLLLSVMTSGMDGYEICRRVKKTEGQEYLKIVMISDFTDVEGRLKGYEAGADDYICRPFDEKELLAKVKVMARYHAVEDQLLEMNDELQNIIETRSQQLLKNCKLATLGQISSEIAHDIRNPLTAITGFVELLDELIERSMKNGDKVKEKMRRFAGTIRASGKMIEDILNSLKTYSRDGSNDPFNKVSIKELLRNAVELCHFHIAHKSILLEVDDVPEDLTSECRSTQICQVLVNLINNAIDAAEDLTEKWIKLSVKDLGDVVQISVTDSGNGIAENIRDQILMPFFSTKDPSKGTGLGLSISKAILGEHEGEFYIDTECQNTRFVLEIPKLHCKKSLALNS